MSIRAFGYIAAALLCVVLACVTAGMARSAQPINVDNAAEAVYMVPSRLPAGTDRSGAITTGGTAQTIAAANSLRSSLRIQNISAETCYVNEIGGTAAAATSGSYEIASKAFFSVSTNRAISYVCATTGSKFTAIEVL